MLKFKTEVPKCQGVKLLKYKLCFNIPKHYTKYAWVHKKHDTHKCLIFQCNVTNRTSGGDSLMATTTAAMWNFENPTGLMTGFGMPPCHPPLPHPAPAWNPPCRNSRTSTERTKLTNYHLICPISLFSVIHACCCLEVSLCDLKWQTTEPVWKVKPSLEFCCSYE